MLAIGVALCVTLTACGGHSTRTQQATVKQATARPEVTVVAQVLRVYDTHVFSVEDTNAQHLVVVSARTVHVTSRRYSITGEVEPCRSALGAGLPGLSSRGIERLSVERSCFFASLVRAT
jgi:hypothetical protein